MARELPAIAREAQRAGVPLAYVLGIAGAESEFGKTGYAKGRHNPFGYGIHEGLDYGSYAQATRAMLSGIKSGTYHGAKTISDIAKIYAPSSENDTGRYTQNVARIASMFGGQYSPDSAVIGGGPSGPMPNSQAPSDASGGQQQDASGMGGLDTPMGKLQMLSALKGMSSPDKMTQLSSLLTLKGLKEAGLPGSGNTQGGPGGQGAAPGGSAAAVAHAIFGSPVPGQKPHSATHQTSGLPGYPAYDYMAPAGTVTVSPVTGRITRLSGRDPSQGGSPGGPLGYSIYVQGGGHSYYLTHLDDVAVKLGQRVRQGQRIARVASGPASWSSPHVHMGVR
jgi:murein DD-endopeptidase MepM/ murein hydrolase activator NlpD